MPGTRVVIVGAGSAGAVLAARLSERPAIEVVLLEAGPGATAAEINADDAMGSPNPGRALREASPFVWPTLVARRTSAQEPYRYWRGRGLGGTSAVNGQIAIRPGPEEFADAGAWPDGWRWEDVLPAFIGLEDDEQYGLQPYHGSGGPIPIHRAPLERWEPVDLGLREAALALGYGECADHNAPTGTGVSPFAINSRAGRRVSTNDAYLQPARDDGRPNLHVVGDCVVDTVVFDGDNRAVGVLAGQRLFEGDVVVVAAGAIHTPALLQRSGLGPPEVLRPLGVPVVADLPVGSSLMEHPIAYCVVRLAPAAQASSVDARHTNCTVRYSSGLAHGGRNDLMLIGNNLVGGDPATALRAGILGVALERSRSHGSVRITSTSPVADPAADLAMLSHPDDVLVLRDGARRLFELVRQPPVEALRAPGTTITAGRATAIPDLADDDALNRWLLAECVDGNHAASTCPIGPVLDPSCSVHGVSGLFVVDASSFPTIPAANPHLTVVMLAEVMAERLAARLLA